MFFFSAVWREHTQTCVAVTEQLRECFEKFGKVRSANVATVSISLCAETLGNIACDIVMVVTELFLKEGNHRHRTSPPMLLPDEPVWPCAIIRSPLLGHFFLFMWKLCHPHDYKYICTAPLSEQDRAMATGNTHRKFDEVQACGFEIPVPGHEQTDRQTHWSRYFAPLRGAK